MSNRLLRVGLLALSATALICGVLSACSSDGDPTPASPDATAEAQGLDGAGGDAASGDAAQDAGPVIDAAKEADAAVLSLCQQYPDDPADAMPAEGPRTLYALIAVRALLDAVGSCQIGDHFPDLEDPPPSQITCFGKQLAALAGCRTGGFPTDYRTVNDENGAPCVPPASAGLDTVQLGFRNPATSAYSVQDVDFLVSLVRKAALSTGMPAVDVDRLEALLAAEKAKAAVDGGDGGFSQSTCP